MAATTCDDWDGSMTRITVINPNTTTELTDAITRAARSVAGVDVTVTGVNPTTGVCTVESHAEEAVAAVGVIEQVRRHQADCDAFVIACFGDTGVAAAREVATGPVVGMTEAALQTACLVAHRFGVITMPPRTIVHSPSASFAHLGLGHRCDVRAVDVPVGGRSTAPGICSLRSPTPPVGRSRATRAEAVVLGCAGLADLVGPLTRELGVPVIDGVAAAVGIAAGWWPRA